MLVGKPNCDAGATPVAWWLVLGLETVLVLAITVVTTIPAVARDGVE